jgi:1-phosphatidylinositol-3-phosphate 5-kinase
LSFFEGCNPKLGATIILRGGNRKELAAVRNVLRFMVFVVYNSKLEKAFVMDEFGTPFVQEGKDDEIMDDDASRQKVKFSVEGETASDEQNMDDSEKHNGGSSIEANGACLKEQFEVNEQKSCTEAEKSEAPTKDIDLTAASYIKNVHTSTDNKSCDSLPNVVNSESFQHILDNIVLSSSPLVKYPLPYLLTPEGKQCELRQFMTEDIYWSPLFFGEYSADQSTFEDEADNSQDKSCENVFVKETHPFVFAVLEKDARDLKALELLASYRAEGGRITLRKQDGNLCTVNGIDGLDGIKGDSTVQGTIHGDTFVPTNRAERTESDELPLLVCNFDP